MATRSYPVKLRGRGQLTIPQAIREQWATEDGDLITLVQFNDFAILTPKALKTTALAKQFSQIMEEEDMSLAELLQGLADERVAIYEATRSGDG